MAARWLHHSWYDLLFISSSLTREKSSYHNPFLPLLVSLPSLSSLTSSSHSSPIHLPASFCLPLSEGAIFPCKQEERWEQPCVECEWTPITSSPFSSTQLQNRGHLATGREGGRKNKGTVHFRILPTLKVVTCMLSFPLAPCVDMALFNQTETKSWREGQTQNLSLCQARYNERQVREQGAPASGWGMWAGELTCKTIAVGVSFAGPVVPWELESAHSVIIWFKIWEAIFLKRGSPQVLQERNKYCTLQIMDKGAGLGFLDFLCGAKQKYFGLILPFFIALCLVIQLCLKILIHFANPFIHLFQSYIPSCLM